ncbi:MAG: bifunctional phosphoribosyl-AMP cyclohydrolase/phosphoribosyl-ATP diphosphatase HisIE [Lachnospiraceae bacterium]|nr:bifunctional phosphoribosyl-AMP cyclohydrolase/phosphoribosyl-ATP diphosphatase HisIE [Lachnospiraceae bacterium]
MSERLLKIVPAVSVPMSADPQALAACAAACEDRGADGFMLRFETDVRENPEEFFKAVRECARTVDIPVYAHARYFKLEDVKKLLYAGASYCVFFGADEEGMHVYPEALLRFGADRCACLLSPSDELRTEDNDVIPVTQIFVNASVHCDIPMLLNENRDAELLVLDIDPADTDNDYYAVKAALAENGIEVDLFVSAVDPAEFHWDEKGLIPVIVQDDKTDEVLMMAYMNEESYRLTCETGRMTYYSRSRQSLWVKGETSGHFQYVRSMSLDCDADTILARVRQIGAACHTGNRSCFFTPLVKRTGMHPNPEKVLEDVYAVIRDRKEHPKEGSYTNYLFDKGVDKICKKIGEEATEIVIAAKNPDPEEIIYESADFLYHLMVLMADKGVTWDDILDELSKRESAK